MPGGPIRQYLSYINWIFNPLHGLDTRHVYDLLATSSVTESGLYLNLGYWRDATTIDEASDALAMLAADAGRMGPGDTVLDCGFGFADQDLLWTRRLQPSQIIGLNITASQVDEARRRVDKEKFGDRIDLRLGSATEMPIEDASIDLVIALESAFHFRDRQRFFQEAWRVLRPRGRLVTADILPMPRDDDALGQLRQWLSWHLVSNRFVIPEENAYTLDEYRLRLARAAFDNISVNSIREEVYVPLHQYLQAHPERLQRLHPVARFLGKLALRRRAEHVYAGLDYVLATAEKLSNARDQT